VEKTRNATVMGLNQWFLRLFEFRNTDEISDALPSVAASAVPAASAGIFIALNTLEAIVFITAAAEKCITAEPFGVGEKRPEAVTAFFVKDTEAIPIRILAAPFSV
jgi:hypothetical protein